MKLKQLLFELMHEDSGAVFNPPRGKWINFKPKPHEDELKDEFFELIKTAYKAIGGHAKVKNPDDVFADPNWTYWRGIDIHDDEDFDIIIFGEKTAYGIKSSGVGHDGTSASKNKYLKSQIDDLHLTGHYGEVSGKLAQILIKAGTPIVDDPKDVRKVLGKEVEWNGEHPTDPTMPGSGWYTRSIGGKPYAKILLGKPKGIS